MEVKARAPGKIILCGEHAVVHGSTAVAASIDLYTYVSLRFPTPSGNSSFGLPSHSFFSAFDYTQSSSIFLLLILVRRTTLLENEFGNVILPIVEWIVIDWVHFCHRQ